MSSYHTSFTYLGKNSYDNFKLQIVHFESGDNGEVDSYLSQESVYADSPRGTKRMLYGTKYSDVAMLDITVMRPSGEEFSVERTREIYKWLTGATQYSWMDLYVGDEVKYRLLCFVQNVRPYKIDSRVVGFIITVESSSPWCYSPLQVITESVSGSKVLQIYNPSDDMYTYTQMKTTFENTKEGSLTICNNTLNETSQINNLAINEVVTLSENMMITSDKPSRKFGNDFNYVWPRLKAGVNDFTISGTGNITFQYIYCIKVGDCVGDLNSASDPVCDEDGHIQLDTLPWARISDTPRTLAGYGITDAYSMSSVYNKTEIDSKVKTLSDKIGSSAALVSTISSELSNNYYTRTQINNNYYNKQEINSNIYNKTEVDSKVKTLNSDISSNASLISSVSSDLLNNYYNKIDVESKYYDKKQINNNIYTKKEVDNKIDNLSFDVKSNASLISTISSELTNDYYKKTYVDDNFYNKSQIDTIISELSYDPSSGTGSSIAWSQITGKPTTLSEYRVKTEVQEMINKSIAEVKINIDEAELNAMLAEVLV